MFQSAFSPIRDMRGDATINIISTPHFPASPLLKASEPAVSIRLFENSSVSFLSDWTTDSSSNDAFRESKSCPDGCRCQVCHYADLYGYDGYDSWTTDSQAECQEPENDSSSNGAFRESKSCPDGCRCQVCHYADLYGYDS